MTTVFAPISIGELIDKITILEIKKQYADDDKLKNICQELTLLEDILNSINVSGLVTDLQETLFKINQELWNIENQKRQAEQKMWMKSLSFRKKLENLFDKKFKSVQKFYLGRRILGSGGSKIKVGA